MPDAETEKIADDARKALAHDARRLQCIVALILIWLPLCFFVSRTFDAMPTTVPLNTGSSGCGGELRNILDTSSEDVLNYNPVSCALRVDAYGKPFVRKRVYTVPNTSGGPTGSTKQVVRYINLFGVENTSAKGNWIYGGVILGQSRNFYLLAITPLIGAGMYWIAKKLVHWYTHDDSQTDTA